MSLDHTLDGGVLEKKTKTVIPACILLTSQYAKDVGMMATFPLVLLARCENYYP